MKKYKLTKTDIEFRIDDKLIKFSVYTDLPETFGLNITNAVENWLYRTNKYTAKSLCDYIKSKNTGYKCLTEKEYEKIQTD